MDPIFKGRVTGWLKGERWRVFWAGTSMARMMREMRGACGHGAEEKERKTSAGLRGAWRI